jgi:hypothetical protein
MIDLSDIGKVLKAQKIKYGRAVYLLFDGE